MGPATAPGRKAGQWSRGATAPRAPTPASPTPARGAPATPQPARTPPATATPRAAAARPAPTPPAPTPPAPAPVPAPPPPPAAPPPPEAAVPSTITDEWAPRIATARSAEILSPDDGDTQPVPAPDAGSRRKKEDSFTDAFTRMQSQSDLPTEAGESNSDDIASVRRVFDDIAAVHVAQVRNVMLELRFGNAECSWVESSRPALRSLRTMASQMEIHELCLALDEFCTAVDQALTDSQTLIEGPSKEALLERYHRLIELIPNAFELDGERDRREPIIVESLLRQVDGVEKITIDKLFANGLGRLDALLKANAEDIVAVSGIRREVAAAIADRMRLFRADAPAAFAAPDAAAEHRALRDLAATLRMQNDEYERAASGWSDDAREKKKHFRKEREATYLQIKVRLARLGQREVIARLEKMPFNERIRDIDAHLAAVSRSRPGEPDRGAASREDRPWQT